MSGNTPRAYFFAMSSFDWAVAAARLLLFALALATPVRASGVLASAIGG